MPEMDGGQGLVAQARHDPCVDPVPQRFLTLGHAHRQVKLGLLELLDEGPAWLAGIDVGQLFVAPRPVDLPGWIQGAAAVPYLRKGPVITDENWQAFQQMVMGEAMLFTLFLN